MFEGPLDADNLARVRQAGGIHEVGVLHTQCLGMAVHQGGEAVLAAGDMFGQGHAGIVSRLHDHPHQHLLDRDLGSWLQEHPGGPHALAPGVVTHRDHVLQTQVARFELLEDHKGRHDFSDAGRLHFAVRLLLCKRFAAEIVNQEVGLGVDRRRCRGRCLRCQAVERQRQK